MYKGKKEWVILLFSWRYGLILSYRGGALRYVILGGNLEGVREFKVFIELYCFFGILVRIMVIDRGVLDYLGE